MHLKALCCVLRFKRKDLTKTLRVMNLTAIVLLSACLTASASGFSQKITLNEENAPIQKIFREIWKQSGFQFVFTDQTLKGSKPVTVHVKDAKLDEVLQLCFQQQPFTFTITDGTIVVKQKDLSGSGALQAEALAAKPEAVIQGRVTNEKGEPLAGVSITVKGNATGTSTDADGKYSINVPEGGTLVFTYVDFTSQEVAVTRHTTVNVVLLQADKAMNEVIVTALGITRSVKSLTYAAQTVKGSDLNQAKETNFINSLQGKVAGVTITKDATGPGGESKVLLRGNRSITNSNEPLYVIDGVPLSGGIEMLNSDDVESMTVLKGASAAALYGSQGQNGAIIITTKKSKGGSSINYNGGFTIDQAAVLPQLQYTYGQGDAGIYGANSEESWGPKADGQMVTLWNGNSVPLKGQPGRLKDFFRNAQTYTNSISFQGGDERTQTYFSYGNTAAQGIVRNNNLMRHNLDLKIDRTLTSRLTVSGKLTYIYESVDNRLEPGDAGTYTLPSIYLTPTSIPEDQVKQYTYVDPSGIERQSYWKVNSSVMSNPYWDMNRILYFQKKDRVLGLFTAKYKFTDWIDLQVRGSMDKTMQKNNQKVFDDNYWSQVGSNYVMSEANQLGVNMDALVSFRHSLGKDFNLSGNVGASLQESRIDALNGNANGLQKPNFFFMGNATAPYFTTAEGRTPRVQSLYGTATLKFRSYLYLDVTFRNDWSSALPKGHQSYSYPSAGITAIVSEMVKLPSWITYGKVRLTSANSGFGGTQYLDRNYFTVGPGLIVDPTIQSLGDYKPELTHSIEAGLDWRFFNDRFGFDLTLYNTETKNQLLLIGLPPATLYSQKYINAGLIENKGIEITSDFTPIRTKNFTWTAAVNFSKNINTVKRLTDNMPSVVLSSGDNVYLIEVNTGSSYGDMYVRGWERDAQGRRLVADDGTPVLTDGLDTKIGNFNPDYMLGFSSRFSYKAFSLSFLIDHRQGGVVIGGTQALIDAYGDSKASLNGRENGIVLDGFNQDGKKNTTAVNSQTFYSLVGGRYPIGEFYSYSGTNTRLRELVFGYQLPDKLLSRTKFIKRADLSFVGRNLFFFQRSAPIDPEITRGKEGGGLEYAALPSTRNFGFNLKLTF
jgi:TonB-linked SusC/RagA family outer membrane protein